MTTSVTWRVGKSVSSSELKKPCGPASRGVAVSEKANIKFETNVEKATWIAPRFAKDIWTFWKKTKEAISSQAVSQSKIITAGTPPSQQNDAKCSGS